MTSTFVILERSEESSATGHERLQIL